jgi:hypothetical protein
MRGMFGLARGILLAAREIIVDLHWVVENPVFGIPVFAIVAVGLVYFWKMGIRLEFDVGRVETHHVVYRFNQIWGGLRITVDGKTVIWTIPMYWFSLINTQKLTVGDDEVHHVQIEKERPFFLAAFRSQDATAYVDGKKVAQASTTLRPSAASQREGVGTTSVIHQVKPDR